MRVNCRGLNFWRVNFGRVNLGRVNLGSVNLGSINLDRVNLGRVIEVSGQKGVMNTDRVLNMDRFIDD